jgi:hypothetical protein
MTNRILLAGLLAGFRVLVPPAAAQEKVRPPVVAVFDIEQPTPVLKPEELVTLTNYLSIKLGESGRLLIIPSKDIRRLIAEQKKESYRTCYDEACQIEIGRELAAQYTVSGSLGKVGDSCLVTAAVFDLAKAATVKTASGKGLCKPDELIQAVESIALALEDALAPIAAPKRERVPDPVSAQPPPVFVAPPTPPFRPSEGAFSWARTAGILGIVGGLGAAGLAAGSEATKWQEDDLASNLMGAVALTLVGALGPIMSSASNAARFGTAADGSPGSRLTAWIGYGVTMTGGGILLIIGLTGDSVPPDGLISTVGGVGLLSLVLFAVDDFVSASEVRALYPDKTAAAREAPLVPVISPVRMPDGSTGAVLGLAGRF